jgi:sugar phosphate isomerase/epimerase
MDERVVSLAAGVVLDVAPADAVDVAAAAGFDAVGIWFDPASWTSATASAVRRRLDATGLIPLDIEPVILGRAEDPGDAIVDAAAELGVRHVLFCSGPAPRELVVERFGELCDRARPAGVVMALEFLPIFTIGSLDAAVSVVEEAGRPNGAVLVDTLHLSRSGGTPDDMRALSRDLFPYLQIADAPNEPPGGDPQTLRDEALNARLLPGEGVLPLNEVLDAVPDVPLSLEIRSAALMTRYPDPVERSRAVLDATRQLLAERSPATPAT